MSRTPLSSQPTNTNIKLIPEKSPNSTKLPKLSQTLTPVKNSRIFSLTDDPVHKENLIPIKHATPKSSNLLNTITGSPVPVLTPPKSKNNVTRIYDSFKAGSVSTQKRSFSTPIRTSSTFSRPSSVSKSSLTKSSTPTRRKSIGLSKYRSPSVGTASSLNHREFHVAHFVKFASESKWPELRKYDQTLEDQISEYKQKNNTLKSFKNLKLDKDSTWRKDEEDIAKWSQNCDKLSLELLELYQSKVLKKHSSFREYKLAKFDSYRKSLRWKLVGSIDEKFEEMSSSDQFKSLPEYEKKCVEKDYQEQKKQAIEFYKQKSDLQFKQMFKNDIIKTNNYDPTNDAWMKKHCNNPSDVLDEYSMQDLYRDLKLKKVK